MGAVTVAHKTQGSVMQGVRVAAQLRQIDLGAKLGLTEDRISNIENDKSPLTVGVFMQWCRACEANPESVITTLPDY